MPAPVFQIASLGVSPKATVRKTTCRWPSGASDAASSAFLASSLIIIMRGHRSMVVATRKSVSSIWIGVMLEAFMGS
ncbi:MAG: hypothetical protein K2X61_00720 [Caulobacteraceae bacterium]|nr:hypothetical protein [Caulobacteraceae bacterium]